MGAASGVNKLILLCEVSKFPGGELWAIVAPEGLRDAVSGEYCLEAVDDGP